jgi:hypothetical protein
LRRIRFAKASWLAKASASAKATADGASGAFVSAISEIKPGRSITIELNGLKLNEGWV